MSQKLKYRIGIDVGLHSVGLAAVEVEEDSRGEWSGAPLRLLGAVSFIHDSGVDPSQGKTGKTRLAQSGVARRARRLIQRRRKRRRQLDSFIKSQGWPVVDLESQSDAWLPWRTRALLASHKIIDSDELGAALSIAVRHMARHRGWRSPWTSVGSLMLAKEPSEFLDGFRSRVELAIGQAVPVGATPAQLVMLAGAGPSLKLRGQAGLLGGKLHQSDNVLELRAIARTQDLPESLLRGLVEHVFAAESPKGSAAKRVGHDVLPKRGHLPRAAKSTLAFQRFRIAATIGNLRVVEGGSGERRLSVPERAKVMEFLDTAVDQPLWAEVAELLGLGRRALRGTATDADGEPAATRPPINLTNRALSSTKTKPIRQWWSSAGTAAREALVQALSNAGELSEGSPGSVVAAEFLESMDEAELSKLDGLHLPAGRAAYSVESLREITERILSTEDDLFDARKELFGLDDDWRPPVEPIGQPVGNPAVDRALKIVARWLQAAQREWGTPLSVTIEHVRDGFLSESAVRSKIRDDERRFARRRAVMEEIRSKLSIQGRVSAADVRRFEAIHRQNCQCLYCGTTITYQTTEIDHIVPRANSASNNKRANLAAACSACNQAKSNKPFAAWAATDPRPGVSLDGAIQRVDQFLVEDGLTGRDRARFLAEVKRRLRATEVEDEIDARDIESVAWMANQLHLRIAEHFGLERNRVKVFRGEVTAWARRTSGMEGRLEMIGGRGKSRLDRRHHAVDAAVIAMLRPSVAAVLAERQRLRFAEQIKGETGAWKTFKGGLDQGKAVNFERWLKHMDRLTDLLNEALAQDQIPVMENLRLRLGSSAVHDDTIKKLDKRLVGEAIPAQIVNRASSPALWCALTRQPDYTPEDGLPANPERVIRVRDRYLGPDETIGFFPSDSAAIAVRKGYADIGGTIHHARVYRIETGKKTFYGMIRVFHADLVPHRSEDLFQVELPPQSISMRTAEPRTRNAVQAGQATYLGWLVEGDELVLDITSQTKHQVSEFLAAYPGTVRWRVAGFMSPKQLRLRPRQLASEGLEDTAADAVRKVIDSPGWLPSVDVVMGKCRPSVVRRDALGRPRDRSAAHLPVSWSV
jgi:CRISPR-associated endonuclease Csn1